MVLNYCLAFFLCANPMAMISCTTVVRSCLRRGRAPGSYEVSFEKLTQISSTINWDIPSFILSSSAFSGASKPASSIWWMPDYLRHRCRINSTSHCFWVARMGILVAIRISYRRVLDASCLVSSNWSFVGDLSECTNDLPLGPSSLFSYQMGNVAATKRIVVFANLYQDMRAAEHSLTCCVRWRRLAWRHSDSCAEVWPYIQLEKVRTKRVLKEERERSKIRFNKRKHQEKRRSQHSTI